MVARGSAQDPRRVAAALAGLLLAAHAAAQEAPADGWELRVQQNFQRIEVEALRAGQPLAVSEARLDGERIRVSGAGFSFSGRVAGARIAGELARGTSLTFERAP